MRVVFKVNHIVDNKIVKSVVKNWDNFPLEGLPHVGDALGIVKANPGPDDVWRNPIARRRTRIYDVTRPITDFVWWVEFQTDSPYLLQYLMRNGWQPWSTLSLDDEMS